MPLQVFLLMFNEKSEQTSPEVKTTSTHELI